MVFQKPNSNGKKLEDLLEAVDIACVKNKKPTHMCYSTGKLDILDIILTSSNLTDKITHLEIHQNELHSDHFPVLFEIEGFKTEILSKAEKTKNINFQVLQKLINKKIKLFNERNLDLSTLDLYEAFLKANSLSKSSATYETKKHNKLCQPTG